MNLEFLIENQIISQENAEKLVQLSQNYLTLSFTFNDIWDNLNKYIIFHSNNHNYCLELENDTITVPSEALKTESFVISLFGTDGETYRITTNKARIDLITSGYTEEFTPIDNPEVDAFTDIYAKITTIEEGYLQKSEIEGLVRNDGSVDTNHYLTEHQDISHLLEKSDVAGLVRNDNSIDTNQYLTEHQDISNYVQKSLTEGLIKNDGSIDTNHYLTEHQDLSNYVTKSNTKGLIKNDGTIDTTQYLSEHQSLANYYTKVEVDELFEELREESTWMVMNSNTNRLTKNNRKLNLTVVNAVNGVPSDEDTRIYFFKEEEEE